jgi:hypothetical protein
MGCDWDGYENTGYMGKENLVRIREPGRAQGIWGVRTDQELRELYIDLELLADIKNKRLEWVGHVARRYQWRIDKGAFEDKPERSRRTGKPRLRRLENVKMDLREMWFRR